MNRIELSVGLGDRSYPIWIGAGLLDQLGDALAAVAFPKQVALITNTTVDALYGDRVRRLLSAAGYSPLTVVLADGEQYKSLETLKEIFDELIAGGIDRGAGIVALGGGVVGDIAGFAAATYLRGIPFVQIPTTLLAQVDSSVGGKTAVNHPLGKNLIGAFYQPRHVLIDVDTLQTLTKRDFTAGLAEVVKYGVIRDAKFLSLLEQHQQQIMSLDRSVLMQVIATSCQIKADIVESDETEQGTRALLNFGHTYGHAVETLAGYGEFRHGEAVAIGMVIAARISRAFGFCTADEVSRLTRLLQQFCLPTDAPRWDMSQVMAAVARDKKIKAGQLMMVLNHGLGEARIHPIEQPDRVLAAALQ